MEVLHSLHEPSKVRRLNSVLLYEAEHDREQNFGLEVSEPHLRQLISYMIVETLFESKERTLRVRLTAGSVMGRVLLVREMVCKTIVAGFNSLASL